MNCRGDEDIDAKRSRPSIGKPVMGHARKERVVLFGTDQRITSGPAAKRPHSKAEYMTAPERFADSQIPLAPRAPSIHDPDRSLTTSIRGTDVTECLRRSLRLDVRELDHLGPLLGFVGDQAAEIGGVNQPGRLRTRGRRRTCL